MKTSSLIYNPIAGRHPARREKQIRAAAAQLWQSGIEAQLKPTTGPGTGCELAQAAVREGKDLVLVCGGDGTINEVINGLAPSQIPLGILPGGTANILAKELRLPHDPVRAAQQLGRWAPRRIALGQATWSAVTSPATPAAEGLCRRYFVSVAGIGFDAHIVYKLSFGMKMSLGVAGYILAALREVRRYGFPVFSCRVGESERCGTFAVLHRTRLYAGWLHLAPSANLFEPRLTLCLFKSPSRRRYFRYAGAVLARRHLRLNDVELVDATQVSCTARDSSQTIRFELDGELVGTLPATFEIVPDALSLLVP